MFVIRMKAAGLFRKCDCLTLESSTYNSLQNERGGKVKKGEKAKYTHNIYNRRYSLSPPNDHSN